MTLSEPVWDELVPEVTLRPQQREALSQIWQAFWGDYKNVVFLEAPTGVGKSIIQLALGRYVSQIHSGNTYVVTPQKVLQDQMKGWANLKIMKGKGSYECTLMSSSGVTARNAPCNLNAQVREDNPKTCSAGACPFYTALEEAQNSEIVMHNYASLLAQAHMSRHFGRRSVICLDEAHTAVGWIRNYMTCDFQPADLMTLTTDDPPENPKYFLPWLRWQLTMIDEEDKPSGLSDEMAVNLMKMFAHKNGFGLVSESTLRSGYAADPKDRKSFESYAKHELVESGDVPWHTEWFHPDRFHPDGYWRITPIKVAPMAKCLTGLGGKLLVVTATILHKNLFAAELGLKGSDVVDVCIESAFDASNRPIKKMYCGSMSFRNKKRTYPKVVDKLVSIASIHSDEPGIIHTVSHYLASDIVESLRDRMGSRVIEQLPRGSERTFVIQSFLSGALGPNAILVGPSLMEGVDGADDSCRWQAMVKAPWPHMKDPTVEFLMAKLERRWSTAWYNWKATQITVQGIGRIVRSASDRGTTYLLDSGFERILNAGYVPQYVIDAII